MRDLLRALLSKRIIGKKHTPEGNVLRRIKHLPQDERRRVLKEWEQCKRNGLALS